MNFFETLNIYGIGPKSQDEFIKHSKFMSYVENSNSKKNNKEKRCFICKKKNITFCNSHTIPQFVLKNIAENGKLNNTQIFNSARLVNTESGINNALTFHSICKNCDNTVFKLYETPENIENELTQDIMKQIALKNHLSRLFKHNKEKRMHSFVLNSPKNTSGAKTAKDMVKQMEIVTEYNCCYNRRQANTILKFINDDTKLYKLSYYKKLDYVVPLTIQSNSVLAIGFNDELLVNGFKTQDLDIADDIHLCIYPLKTQTVICIFCSANIEVYDDFFNTLNKKKLSEQLSIINFITFAYFEDIYLHQKLDSSILNDSNLQRLIHAQMMTLCDKSVMENLSVSEHDQLQLESVNEDFSIDNHSNIPNLLDKKYKIVN